MTKLEVRTDGTNLDKFLLISKKLSEIFLSPNIVLVTQLSILVQLCSSLVDRLPFKHNCVYVCFYLATSTYVCFYGFIYVCMYVCIQVGM